jgi:trehalose utilization protein
MRVTIFTEKIRDKLADKESAAYPEGGMNACLYSFLSKEHEVKMIVQDPTDDVSALTEEILDHTDVLVWWSHIYHGKVAEEVVSRVTDYVNRGMGLIALHSSHKSRVFMRLLGTPADLLWREANERERLWIIDPTHPIARGIEGRYVEIPHEEMYGEPFSIPTPDELVFIGWFQGGEVFRSGCVFNRSRGKIFYFQPGHETNAVYSIPEIQRIILNAVDYVAPRYPLAPVSKSQNSPAIEKLD